jgi:hypothetical protein
MSVVKRLRRLIGQLRMESSWSSVIATGERGPRRAYSPPFAVNVTLVAESTSARQEIPSPDAAFTAQCTVVRPAASRRIQGGRVRCLEALSIGTRRRHGVPGRGGDSPSRGRAATSLPDKRGSRSFRHARAAFSVSRPNERSSTRELSTSRLPTRGPSSSSPAAGFDPGPPQRPRRVASPLASCGFQSTSSTRCGASSQM